MSNNRLPRAVHEFIRAHIESVFDLEALLLFKKDHNKTWSAESLSRELRTNAQMAQKQLSWLLTSGFIEPSSKEGEFKYKAKDQGVDKAISDLAKVYSQQRMSVVAFISDRSVRVREFADAFIFRKDKKDG